MAWNDQNMPVQGPVPAYGQSPPPAGSSTVPSSNAAVPVYGSAYSQQPGSAASVMATPPAPGQQPAAMPGAVAPAGSSGATGAMPPPGPTPVGAPAPQAAGYASPARPMRGSDKPDAGDDIWISRAKRAIAETQNDPHRQVQLLQHLNKLYLKERFGREVQADKG